MLLQIRVDAILPLERIRHERERLRDAFIGLRAAQPQESFSRLAKAFAAETGDAARLIGAFQQIQRQPV